MTLFCCFGCIRARHLICFCTLTPFVISEVEFVCSTHIFPSDMPPPSRREAQKAFPSGEGLGYPASSPADGELIKPPSAREVARRRLPTPLWENDISAVTEGVHAPNDTLSCTI